MRTCVDGFVANASKAERRLKRGGDAAHVSFDAAAVERELDFTIFERYDVAPLGDADRPTYAALADDVRRFQAGEPVAAYPEGPLEKAVRFAHTYRTPLLLFATYLLVRALVFLFAGT